MVRQTEKTAERPSPGLMPPYLVLRDFLDRATAADLLAYSLANEHLFEPTKVGRRNRLDPSFRISAATRELGRFRPLLKTKILELVPDLVARLRTSPVPSPKIELQLVAHNDGAFYKRHIDTLMVANRHGVRVLSGVYYYNAEPKAFSGGAFRLYAIGDADYAAFTDIEPVHNSLLVFPSWAPHEVTPIGCPSKRFADSRFTVTCMVNNMKNDAA
jgi:SM-20-related protein